VIGWPFKKGASERNGDRIPAFSLASSVEVRPFGSMMTSRKASGTTGPQGVQRYGVTDPISVAEPQPEDMASTERLTEMLKAANFFEDEEESLKR
jgi:hypothetical protein